MAIFAEVATGLEGLNFDNDDEDGYVSVCFAFNIQGYSIPLISIEINEFLAIDQYLLSVIFSE